MTPLFDPVYFYFLVGAIIIFGIIIGTKIEKKQDFENLNTSQIGAISAVATLAILLLVFGIYMALRYQTGQILRKYGL
jgi:predicted transporter